jgi:SAM-dependent methyltransferase
MPHLTRYYMYRRINEILNEPLDGKILGISGIGAFRPLISEQAEVLDVHYPEVDMQNLPFKENSFDFVISDQVLEHLDNPKKAVTESYRVLKRGGIAIHTTCFINYLHPCPKDYWRFSPEALKYLCNEFSEILCYEGWGSRIAFVLCSINDRFRFMPIPDTYLSVRRIIASYNEANYPISTWVIARK